MFMTPVPASPEPETSLPPSNPVEDVNSCLHGDTDGYVEILHEIMHISMDLARAIRQDVRNNPGDARANQAAVLAIDRIAQTIRRCMLLACKLKEGRPARATSARSRSAAPVNARAERQAAQTRAPPQAEGDAETTESEHAEPREYAERLDRLPPGTVPEIIATLCNDLARVANRFGRPTERRRLLATTRLTTRPAPNPPPDPEAQADRRVGCSAPHHPGWT
jgi:hypothetical protein